MPRTSMVLGAFALLVTGLLPATAPAVAAPQPKDDDRYVNLDVARPGGDPLAFKRVAPDTVTTTPSGSRIEVYGSVGDNEGGMDWRTVNAFSYLVNSVPKGATSYTTLFNSLYDFEKISHQPGKAATPDKPAVPDQWNVTNRTKIFAPTAAYLNQVNLYETEAERKKYIKVLGAKESIDEAWDANSSLARLVQAGYKRSGPQAVDYQQCAGKGGCLSGTKGLMHSKFGAFEKAADSTGTIRDNVVWITSSNLNGSSGSKKSNISIAIYGDDAAYSAVKDGIFLPSMKIARGETTASQVMRSGAYAEALALTNGVMTGMKGDAGSGITLYPSPRRTSNAADNTASTDVEAAFLKEQVNASSTKPGCRVYAVHSLFNSTRNGVFEGLGDLAKQRCDVRVVLGDNAISDIVDGYFNMSSKLREVIGQVEFANVHDKTLSYSNGSTATTFGGASNFTGTSLEYDELAFRADNAAVTKAVQDHSERVYQLARGQVTWTRPSSVSASPASTSSKPIPIRNTQSVQLSERVAPSNALVTKVTWTSENPAVASVSSTGRVTGLVTGSTRIKVTVESPDAPTKTGYAYVKVAPDAKTSVSAGGRANLPPTLTMDNYQSPGGTTDIVVTWGSNGKNGARSEQYDGVVKLQYYSKGWKTYGKNINVKNGVGRIQASMKGSKTWRAYGARLDAINGQDVPNSTAKTKSKWSINTVRTKTASSTPRLYATGMAKKSSKVPFLLSWAKNNGKVRLQMRSSGGKWKTHSTYTIDGTQTFVSIPVANTKYWRIATSTGSTKTSNTVKVAMK